MAKRTRKGMPVNVFSFEKSAVDYLANSDNPKITIEEHGFISVVNPGTEGNYIHPVVAIS